MNRRRNRTPFATLIRWSGWASALAGVLFGVWGYLDREDAPWYLDVAVLMLAIVVPLLFLIGLAGVYAKCRRQASWLGKSGFVLSFVGVGRGILEGIMNAYAWQGHVAERGYWEQDYIAYVDERGWLLVLLDSWLSWLLVGLTIAGLAAAQMRGLRNWGFLLLTMALFGWVYQFTDFGTIVEVRSVHVGSGVLFILSWMVLGYALWSSGGSVGRTATKRMR